MKNRFQISHTKENYTKPVLFHSHDFFEIYFFLDGKVTYYIENEVYTLEKGDVLVIPPGKLHRPVIEENVPYERCVLWLYSSFLLSCEGAEQMVEEITRMISEKNIRWVHFDGENLRTMRGLFDKLLFDFESGEPLARYTAEGCIALILGEIRENFRNMEKVDEQRGDVVRQVIAYLNENIADAPSLEELAAQFFVSKYYLSHRFKEYTKTTIHQYILMKKSNLAKELLEKGNPPQEVSVSCGFTTYANFYKAFTRLTGMTPRDYRRQWGQGKVV